MMMMMICLQKTIWLKLYQIGAKARHLTSRLTRLGIFDGPSSPVRTKVEYCRSRDQFGCRSQTAQSPGSRPEALKVATHGQRVTSLGEGSYPPEEIETVHSTAPFKRVVIVQVKNTARITEKKRSKNVQLWITITMLLICFIEIIIIYLLYVDCHYPYIKIIIIKVNHIVAFKLDMNTWYNINIRNYTRNININKRCTQFHNILV